MWKRLLGASLPILLLSAFSAQAESEFGQERGGYLALSGMYNHDVSSGSLEGYAGDSGGVTGRMGFRVGSMVAIEIQGDWNEELSEGKGKKRRGFAVTTNLRVYPLTKVIDDLVGSSGLEHRIQPYVVAGVGVITARAMTHQHGGTPYRERALNGAFRLGGGIDYYLTERIALSAGSEWVVGTGRLNDLGYVTASLGAQYNF